MTDVLKLGGSLITDKTGTAELAPERLAAVAESIAATEPASLVLVHGGGSFGHPVAEQHGISETSATRDPGAIVAIDDAMERLSKAVVSALHEAGVPAVCVRTSSMTWRDADDTVRVTADPIAAMLAEGFVPVLRGDVAVHEGVGASIVSGDDVSIAIAKALSADRVGLCSDVPGVLDEDGTVIPTVEAFEDVAAVIEGPEGADVTGGIGGKIEAVLQAGIPASLFGPDDLDAFLTGAWPGTTVARDAGSF